MPRSRKKGAQTTSSIALGTTESNPQGGTEPSTRLGRHKHDPGWQDKLAKAHDEWKASKHDLEIAKPFTDPGSVPLAEIPAAIAWECFRHLYFSDELPQFWKALVERDRIDVLEKFYKESWFEKYTEIYGDESNHLFSWADDRHFPCDTWVQMRESPHCVHALHEAPKRRHVKIVRKVPDTSSLCADFTQEINSWRKAKKTIAIDLDNPKEVHEILEVCSSAFGRQANYVILEIDWDSTKKELTDAFWKEIEPMHEEGLKGRRDGPRGFFAGLAIRRRLSRGLAMKQAIARLYGSGEVPRANDTSKKALATADRYVQELKKYLQEMPG